ncbi:MAG: 2-amino-4-hydroxy-6-hydroxymethyldihydropteridine diphosphokinase [Planctomycetota bacterium]
MARCLIGCGSNLGQRREQLDRALELLRFMPGVELVAVSRYRETRPVGGPGNQAAYLNGACLIETELPPREVLGALFAVENTLHRRREHRWGERTIDLDLLLYDDLVVESPDLTLPHPRMATRRFVLEPCVEIAAELAYPPSSCTIRDLLDNISVPNPLVAVVGVPGSGATEVAAAVADATLTRLVRAPTPLPFVSGGGPAAAPSAGRLLETVASWRDPLLSDGWEDDPHGTVTDYWLDAVPAAATDWIAAAAWPGFARDFERLVGDVVSPQVAIFLRVGEQELRERIAFRSRPAARLTDVFADAPPAVGDRGIAETAAALVRLQERLERRLRCPADRCPRAPKAVISIGADDLAAATADATAAVEAML